MIERYTRPAMGRIWTEENKYRCWLEVESAASTVLAQEGVIPEAAAKAIAEKAGFTVARIQEIALPDVTDLRDHLGDDRGLNRGGCGDSVLGDVAGQGFGNGELAEVDFSDWDCIHPTKLDSCRTYVHRGVNCGFSAGPIHRTFPLA